ncbi:MAG: M20 family metallopeptidase [Pseudomonadota bacterium]
MQNFTPLELTQHLVGFNTVNPPGDEHVVMEKIGAVLEDAGFTTQIFHISETRSNLVASLDGSADGLPIVFTGHIDVVPLGDVDWSFDPFRGETDSGRIYGRGTSDMKSGIATMMLAALRVAKEPKRKRGLVLIFTADEEVGCAGSQLLVKEPMGFDQAGAIVVGEPTGNYPLIGHKGIIWAQVETHGVSAHASMPEQGDNALSKMAKIIARIDEHGLGIPEHPILGGGTHNVGTLQSGSNPNLVPNHACMGIDIRTVAGQSNDDVLHALKHLVGNDADVTPTVNLESVMTDHEDEWVQSCFDITEPVLGKRPKPKGATYVTDASILKPALGNPPTIILGPGEPTMAHKTDEYCDIDKLDKSIDVYHEIAHRWCFS